MGPDGKRTAFDDKPEDRHLLRSAGYTLIRPVEEHEVDAEGKILPHLFNESASQPESPQKRKDRKENLEFLLVLYNSPKRQATARKVRGALGWKEWKVKEVKKRLVLQGYALKGVGGDSRSGCGFELTKKGFDFLVREGAITPPVTPGPF